MTIGHLLLDDLAAVCALRRCEIRVRGLLGPTVLEAFPALTYRPCGRDTLLAGAVEDQAELYGVLHSLEALGLDLVDVRVRGMGESPEPDDDASSDQPRACRPQDPAPAREEDDDRRHA